MRSPRGETARQILPYDSWLEVLMHRFAEYGPKLWAKYGPLLLSPRGVGLVDGAEILRLKSQPVAYLLWMDRFQARAPRTAFLALWMRCGLRHEHCVFGESVVHCETRGL
eukprot:2779416-Pleurochrysis_carterae.AAC.2